MGALRDLTWQPESSLHSHRHLSSPPGLPCYRYTGADLAALVRQAAMAALEEDLDIAGVSARHFHQALQVPLVPFLMSCVALFGK